MKIKSISNLRNFLENCYDLYALLTQYVGLNTHSNKYEWDEIKDNLIADDTLWSIADQNGMHESDMEDWLKYHLYTPIECHIIDEHGPGGGWPAIRCKCCDIIFYLDWVLDK